MMDFLKIIQGFEKTPVPAVLVIGGVLFLFLAVGGRFGVGGEGVNRKISSIIGTLLLILGLSLYAVPVIISSSITPTSTQDEQSVNVTEPALTSVPQSMSSTTETNIPTSASDCAFITENQIEELKNIQNVSNAITQAEQFAQQNQPDNSYPQNDYEENDTIPAGILIATDLRSSDLDQFGVVPINNQGGWGLFITSHEMRAPRPGTYWCIRSGSSGAQNTSSQNDERDVAAQALGYNNLDAFIAAFGIPNEVKPRIFTCPGEEGWCLSVFEEQGQPDFHFRNITKCTLDGKQANGVSGIPVDFDGAVRGFTVRPCSTQ